jgi:hypothetical protein
MTKVFVVNKSAHDFSPAKKFGEVIFLSEGPMNRYAANNIHRSFKEAMADSSKDDYIVPCSLNVMNSIACAIFAKMHGRLNLLLFKDGEYIERNLII